MKSTVEINDEELEKRGVKMKKDISEDIVEYLIELKNRDEVMEIIEDGGSFYCPVCQNKVCHDAAFCCACGQRLGETGEDA